MAKDIEHHFIYILTIHISLEKCLFSTFAYLLIDDLGGGIMFNFFESSL